MSTIAPPPPQPPIERPPSPRVTSQPLSPRPPRRRPPRLVERLGETVAALGALAIAGCLWWAGAFFTLYCLAQLGAPVDALGAWRWSIPAGASAIEVWWWPRRRLAEYKAAVFGGVAALDLGSTLYATVSWGRGRTLPIGTGITLPESGAGLIIPAVVVSLGLTFVPERLALWALNELREIWSGDHDDD